MTEIEQLKIKAYDLMSMHSQFSRQLQQIEKERTGIINRIAELQQIRVAPTTPTKEKE